jgi:hypothetical protein
MIKIRSIVLSPILWIPLSILIGYLIINQIHAYQFQLAKPSFFLGTWENLTNTDSFTRIIIQNDTETTYLLHLFATCVPIYCDWGEAIGYYLNGHIHAIFKFSYKTTNVDLYLTNEGMLKVIQVNNYFDPNRERQKIDIPPSILGRLDF